MSSKNIIKNALISVYDKTHIIEISTQLTKKKINIFSTGGTSNFLKKNNIPIINISDYTKFPEIMNGRLKTLHPKIMAGILNRPEKDQDIMKLYDINPIDIVIVNFYPFTKICETTNNIEKLINYIDIGGPTLVRAAAKNYKNVIVIVDINDFDFVIKNINKNTMTIDKRFNLAAKAFQYTSKYESVISSIFSKTQDVLSKNKKNVFPEVFDIKFTKKNTLRYGENQHQKACLYIEKHKMISGTISASQQIQGKSLSYNNISDSDIALECVKEFQEPACVIVKHGNPCGVAVHTTLIQSYISAYTADPVSAFGGIIAFNCTLDALTSQKIIQTQFAEVIIAPRIKNDAIEILKQKKNLRVLICGDFINFKKGLDFKRIQNGILVQEYDNYQVDYNKWKYVTKKKPNSKELKDAIFCWKVAKFVKSNAIVYGKNNVTLGIGAGQMSRIDSTTIANIKAKKQGFNIIGAAMSSDAFFPFRDGIDSAASVGINCIIQPGGSIKDQEIIDAANEHNITMIFTKTRHFKH